VVRVQVGSQSSRKMCVTKTKSQPKAIALGLIERLTKKTLKGEEKEIPIYLGTYLRYLIGDVHT
jgi:hypothetical protein